MDPALALEIKALSHVRAVKEAEESGESEIRKLYKDGVVFITGGTGFLGKQLIEKLFRACRDIKHIYLLSRSKKDKDMNKRLEEQLKDPVYDEVRRRYPEFERRITPIEGDVNLLRLGLKEEDWMKLANEVNFIFHVAATVRFDEPLTKAVLLNVRGTREVLSLAKDCRDLKAVVHYSTAYAFCNHREIKEHFYDVPISPSTMIELAETLDEEKFDKFTPIISEGWPNTYTFSKAVAEVAIKTFGEGLPVCIIRPAIVSPCHQEPGPGWVDQSNVSGPSGVILGCGIGVIRTIYSRMDVEMDIVPADYVNNLAIAASWDTASRRVTQDTDIQIYTLSRKRNKVTWGDMQDFLETKARKLCSPKGIWYGYSLTTSNRVLFEIYGFFLHYIPALFLDSLLMLFGNKLRFKRIYAKAHKINMLLSYFLFNSWILHDQNTIDLIRKLPKIDRDIFCFDITAVGFNEFMAIWCLGLRKYIIKDELKGTDKAVKRQKWYKILNAVVLVLYAYGVFKLISFLWGVFH